MILPLIATAPKGVEPLLSEELQTLGATAVKPGQGMVSFQGTLETAYRACLWSRTASRILLPLADFPAIDPETLYQGVKALPWEEHLKPDGTLAVDFTGTGTAVSHSQFGAQKIKDAIVDRFREGFGQRPSVRRQRPDLSVYCHLRHDRAVIGLDLAGESLHRRGYRQQTVAAPLKENLAAALLLKAGWPEIAATGGALLDPLCGSGTLLIEAAWLAVDSAPGLRRDYWGFLGWRQHDPILWQDLMTEARQRREQGLARIPTIVGYDRDPRAIRATWINAGRAGVRELVHCESRELNQLAPPKGRSGLLITNPPYGERLGEWQALESLYQQLGDLLKARFGGWRAAVFTGNPDLGKRMGLKARRVNAFYNGALPCKLLDFLVDHEYFVDREAADQRVQQKALDTAMSGGGDVFANRLRKNLRTLGRWARREGITCYRVYDADIPEYAVAVDIYQQWVHVQEYQAPPSVPADKAAQRLQQVMAIVPAVLEVPREHVFVKVRQRQKGLNQYQKQDESRQFYRIHEGDCRFWVNFTDYLDTGLFLDHRPTRRLIGELAQGRRFLNLFAYTGTATVYAALGGAETTNSVDMSRTYLDWTRRNLALNEIVPGSCHRLMQEDCLAWLERTRERFDLIFLDPPTFSNSKRMKGHFDIQRDHGELLRKTVRLLEGGGILIFSTHHRRFKMDQETLVGWDIGDISQQTIPRDFTRRPNIHRCWKITRAG